MSGDNWDSHWQNYARSAQSNPAQEYRRQLILRSLALEQAGPPVRILDVGSGQGDLSRALHVTQPDAEILGLELSQSGVDLSREKVPTACFLQRNLLEHADPPASFTAWATHAVCSEVLEHVDDPRTVLRNVRPYLGRGARLVITVPGGPASAFDRHIGHRKHYHAEDLTALVGSAGFAVESCHGAGFPFFNLYRMTVILRGAKLIQDVASSERPIPLSARIAMAAFSALFRLNLDRSDLGWQMVCVARKSE